MISSVRLSIWRSVLWLSDTSCSKSVWQVNRKCPLGTRFYNVQPPTPTISPQIPHSQIQTLLIYYISLSWSRDHFLYVATNRWPLINASYTVRRTIGYFRFSITAGRVWLLVAYWLSCGCLGVPTPQDLTKGVSCNGVIIIAGHPKVNHISTNSHWAIFDQ